MNSFLQVFYSVFSGLLLSVAIPNELFHFGYPLASFFAISFFYCAIKSCKSYKKAFFCTFMQVLTTHLCSSFWLVNFKDFAIFTLGGSALATAFIGGIFGIYLYLPYRNFPDSFLTRHKLYKKISETPAFRILYFASIYTLYEWYKSSGFLGYPWGTISSSMFNWPVLMQISDITGAYGITFITVFFNCLLAEFISYFITSKTIYDYKKKINYILQIKDITLTFIVLFITVILYGTFQYNKTRTPIKQITSILVQQNADPWITDSDEERILTSQRLTREKIKELEQQGKTPQLVVWSEGTLMSPFPYGKDIYEFHPYEDPLIPFIHEIKTPFITGGAVIKSYNYNGHFYNKFFNSSLVFDSEGNLRGTYGKLHLVPFAEAIPGSDNPFIRAFLMKIIGISSGWSKGEQLINFDIPCNWYDREILPPEEIIDVKVPFNIFETSLKNKPSVKISTPICFDDSFTDVMRPMFNSGAELFMNITDDSWSLKKSSEYQHFVIAAYDSIEYRTTLVRTTNAGYSVVLDPSGKILYDLPLFEEAALAVDIPIYQHIPTVYSKFGNWLPYLIIVMLFLYTLYSKKYFLTHKSISSLK